MELVGWFFHRDGCGSWKGGGGNKSIDCFLTTFPFPYLSLRVEGTYGRKRGGCARLSRPCGPRSPTAENRLGACVKEVGGAGSGLHEPRRRPRQWGWWPHGGLGFWQPHAAAVGPHACRRWDLLPPAPPMDAAAGRGILLVCHRQLVVHRQFTPIQSKFHPPPHEHSLRHRFIKLIDRFTEDFIWFSIFSPNFEIWIWTGFTIFLVLDPIPIFETLLVIVMPC
jgi:hypothetical protein